MSRMVWLTLIVLVGSTIAASASGALDQVTPAPTAEQLIGQLGHREFRVREAANKTLLERGMSALPALRKAKDHKDPEVRRRIEALLAPLEAAAEVAPKRVTLHIKQRPLRDVIKDLAKQSGYKIELWPDAQFNGDREKQPYSFDLD